MISASCLQLYIVAIFVKWFLKALFCMVCAGFWVDLKRSSSHLVFPVPGGPILIYTSGTSRFNLIDFQRWCWAYAINPDLYWRNVPKFSSALAMSSTWFPCSIRCLKSKNFLFLPFCIGFSPISVSWPSFETYSVLSEKDPLICSKCIFSNSKFLNSFFQALKLRLLSVLE